MVGWLWAAGSLREHRIEASRGDFPKAVTAGDTGKRGLRGMEHVRKG